MERIDDLTDEQCKEICLLLEAEFPELLDPVVPQSDDVELDPNLWHVDENGDEWWIGPQDEQEAAKLLGFSLDLMETDDEIVASLNIGNTSFIERSEEEAQEKEED